MKTINLIQKHPEIKVKNKQNKTKLCHRDFTEMSLQKLITVLVSLYGPHMLVCMPDNVEAHKDDGWCVVRRSPPKSGPGHH